MAEDKSAFVPKEDSAPVLFHGMGAPYLGIFNGQSKPIKCPKNNLPVGTFVKGFEYKYTEDGPDVGEIMIETDNPNLLDHPDLQYYSELWLQWGYIFPDGSCLPGPPRKVIIIGNTCEFTERGTTINLKIADVGVMLKTVPSNFYGNLKGLEDYLKDLLQGEFVGEVSLIDYAEVNSKPLPIVTESVDPDAIKGETEPVWGQGDVGMDHKAWARTLSHNGKFVAYDTLVEPHQKVPYADNIVMLKWDSKTGTLSNQLPEIYQAGWAKKLDYRTLSVTGIPKNKYKQLEEFVSGLDNGPFKLDMRDGRIEIHNRQTQRPIYKVYTYQGGNGELLQFRVESNFVTKAVEVSKSVELDPLDKSINTEVVQGLTNPMAGNIDSYITGNKGIPPIHDRDATRVQGIPKELAQPMSTNLDGTPLTDPAQFLDGTPTVVQAYNEFPNVEAAKKYISNNISKYISQEDINSWFRKFKTDFDTWVNSDDLGKSVQNLQDLPNYTLKMKVKIKRQDIPDMIAAGIMMLQTGKSTEELANMLLSGDLNMSTASWSSTHGESMVSKTKYNSKGAWTVQGKNYTASQAVSVVQEVVNAAGGLVSYEELRTKDSPDLWNNKYFKAQATFEVEIEIPIAGARLLGDPRFKGTVASMGADIEESITNQMKATGTFIGDPIIESSFNMQIQNVSEKYSGIWYTKEVVHRITPESGYVCEVQFVQRSVPVSNRIIKSSWIHSDFASNITEAAKKALEKDSGYSKKTEVTQELKNKFQASDQSMHVLQEDNKALHVKADSDIIYDAGYKKVDSPLESIVKRVNR